MVSGSIHIELQKIALIKESVVLKRCYFFIGILLLLCCYDLGFMIKDQNIFGNLN